MIMSKTKRTSILHRERQTAIQLEKLEPRQLLATVTGGEKKSALTSVIRAMCMTRF